MMLIIITVAIAGVVIGWALCIAAKRGDSAWRDSNVKP